MLRKTHLFRTLLTTFALSSLLAIPAMAAAPEEPSYSGWSWSAHVGQINIDSKVAEQQGIEDSAWAFGAEAERYTSNSNLTFLIGFDYISYGDNYSFTQETNKGNKSSDASAAMLYAEFGPRLPFGKDESNHFTARLGVSGILSSERSISYCSDCYSESIEVDGGLYGVLGVDHTFASFDLGLQFQQYFSGDIDNSLRLRISTSF